MNIWKIPRKKPFHSQSNVKQNLQWKTSYNGELRYHHLDQYSSNILIYMRRCLAIVHSVSCNLFVSFFLRFIPFGSKPSSNNLHDKWNEVKWIYTHSLMFVRSDRLEMKMHDMRTQSNVGNFERDVNRAFELSERSFSGKAGVKDLTRKKGNHQKV